MREPVPGPELMLGQSRVCAHVTGRVGRGALLRGRSSGVSWEVLQVSCVLR